MNESEEALRVQMLGDFRMFWKGKEVQLKSGSATKAMQILQLLLYHAPQKVSSSALISQIFAYDDILSPSNNLKASISLLRKQLRASGLPCEENISFESGGYVWRCQLPTQIDVHEFEKAARRGETCTDLETKIARYEEAAARYTGNFLPKLIGTDWVSPLNVYFSDLYGNIMRKLAALYRTRGEYEQVLTVAERAKRYLRADEWQVLQMQSLMQLGRWDEAKQAYMDAVTVLSKEYDLEPSEELLEQYRVISSQLSNALGTFHDMLSSVREKEEVGGAYFCTYPGFIDSCRVTARSMERSGISCFLMLCCLCDGSGNALQNEERLQDASEKLRNAIQRSLRSSDFYTQYNKSQFLIYLVGTNRENCMIVQDRIENNFRTMSVRGVCLQFEVSSALLNELTCCAPNGMLRWQ
ncbi:MAG: bacterial transcriptional activator domain-containing protein [Oscillospiraceae bacterium]|nr:bacterial transcriptional activator domain-containing protein [Oscillospiraceae bacterium]